MRLRQAIKVLFGRLPSQPRARELDKLLENPMS